jgi:hypothetical protein
MGDLIIATRCWRHAAALFAAVALAAPAAPRAIQRDLGTEDLERAIKIGGSSEAERARFHAAYIFSLRADDPAIEQLEVLTEFRRVVIEAEDRLRRGDHMFGASQARTAIRSWHNKLTLVLRLKFHPQNVLVMVPTYELAIGQPGAAALDVRRIPVYPVTGAGQRAAPGTSMYGATIEADFDVAAVRPAPQAVRVVLEGKEVARTAINFAQID